MKNKEIEQLMREAIEYDRPEIIKPVLLPIWNQPFFYKLDNAKVLTLSYNPTDKGAKTNYPYYVTEYKKNGELETDTILDILYNFKKEDYWRKYYDEIFGILGFNENEIAHMDVSFFPYKTLEDYKQYEFLDDTYKYLLKTIALLDGQLKYIFVDGAKNRNIVGKIIRNEFDLINETALSVNKNNKKYVLSIYKHKVKDLYTIYYGCFLYGSTCPSKTQVDIIAQHIKQVTQ